jgi:glycosyltransferase involved in cell wall biosynthesis
MLGTFPPQPQGISGYCAELAEALSRRCEVYGIGYARMYPPFLFPGVRDPADPSSQPPSNAHLQVRHPLRYYNPLGWAYHAAAVPADVFHAQWWSLPLAPVTLTMQAVMRMRGKPMAVTVHNVRPHEGKRGFAAATRAVCQFAGAAIVHGAENAERFRQFYPRFAGIVHEMPLGAYESSARPLPREKARERLGIPAGKQVVLFFGIIRPYKGVEVLLDAFSRIAAAHPQAMLVVAGKPWVSVDHFHDFAHEHGIENRIRFDLDYIPSDRVPAYFSAADLLVLPYTHFDAQSGVAAEALPYRRPMLTTTAGALADSVAQDPQWTVPPGDAAALANRISRFLGTPEAETAAFQTTADRAIAAMSWEKTAAEHFAIFQRLLAERGKGGE